MTGQGSSSTVAQRWGGDLRILGDDEQAALASWAARLDMTELSAVELAGRRLLTAIGERNSPDDALLDAVIAWESIAGGGPEVSWRVTATLAHLLHPFESARREATRADLKRIYDARSDLAHGRLPTKANSSDLARRAIEYAINALRGLFDYFPDLVTERNRSTPLLLGTSKAVQFETRA
jgi:hypothetical protein